MIYADNAATTKLDIEAFEVMKPFLLEDYSNPSQHYSFSRDSKNALQNSRKIIANCINAKPEEIYFTSGGTESDNWAIKGTALGDYEKGTVITSSFEHHAVLRTCSAIEKIGRPVVYLKPTSDGYITPATLSASINDKTRLVSIMFANNELGSIQPIKDLCAIVHSCGALFHTDAVQAVGHIKIDVHEMGIDMLSASAHKFNGPKGVGFLYVKNGVNIAPLINGGSQESNHRAGTENVASIVGMAIALENNCKRISENSEKILGLEKLLLKQLNQLGIKFVRNGGKNTLPGLLSLSFDGFGGELIMNRMDLKGICISTGSACDSVGTQVSHVLRAIGLDESLAKDTIRISLGKNNTDEDVRQISNVLSTILHKTL